MAQTFAVRTRAEARQVVQAMRAERRSVICRGSGYSYGDAALNGGNAVLDLRGMNRILAWDSVSGLLDVEPGVTVAELAHCVQATGWWPPVVPGTAAPTLGGCVSANVHGKNNWKVGPLGEHLVEIELLLADGSFVVASPGENAELFTAAVGGFGLLGVVTRIRLHMHRSSGWLRLERFAASRLEGALDILERSKERADHMVAWLDGFAQGGELGRGLVDIVEELPSRKSQPPGKGILDQITSSLPLSVRSNLWILLKPLANETAIRRVNAMQYWSGALTSGRVRFASHSRFDFIHDTVPQWNRAFDLGIVQYQTFVPQAMAAAVFRASLEQAQEAGAFPFLTVLKRHRPDSFLLSEGVDGFSMSMDFRVTHGNLRTLMPTLSRITESVVLPAGGRFYLAKDSVLQPHHMAASFGVEAVTQFLGLKREFDPGEVFQSDLYRRLFTHQGA